jgi:hypothetical protein
MKKHAEIIIFLLAAMPIAVGAAVSWPERPRGRGRLSFEAKCRTCHAALPYTGRVGSLAAFLAKWRKTGESVGVRHRLAPPSRRWYAGPLASHARPASGHQCSA